jgi:hypothetical protein
VREIDWSTLDKILSLQSDAGAFASEVHFENEIRGDWNGFVTALVLRALAPLPPSVEWLHARERALDFLESCESRERRGHFGFWPRSAWPSWAPRLTEDADDTAVLTLELLRGRRIEIGKARAVVEDVLVKHRLSSTSSQQRNPWELAGVFLTWLTNSSGYNPIDCCANANVLALMAFAGLTDSPGYREASAMVRNAIRYLSKYRDRARLLTPYYPDPMELLFAIQNAVGCGAFTLQTCSASLEKLICKQIDSDSRQPSHAPVFSSSDLSLVWISEALSSARYLRAQLRS